MQGLQPLLQHASLSGGTGGTGGTSSRAGTSCMARSACKEVVAGGALLSIAPDEPSDIDDMDALISVFKNIEKKYYTYVG
jgi:hypothetical protein